MLVKRGFCPNVLKKKGNLIMVIQVPEASIRIVSSNNYVDGDEITLANTFKLDFIPHFFPKIFMSSKHLSYEGKLPQFECFIEFSDTDERIKLKKEFYNSLDQEHMWRCKNEIMLEVNFKLDLLTNAMLYFINECFEFQASVQKSFLIDGIERQNTSILLDKYVNPFNHPICSLSGLMFTIFGVYYQNFFKIHSIKNEYGCSGKTVSRIEHQFTSYMEYKYPNRHFMSAFNNEKGQKFFKEAIPDLFCNDTGTCWFFNGCAHHPHKNCTIYKSNKTPFGQTLDEANTTFENKMSNLMLNHTNVNSIEIQWECIFKKQMLMDPHTKYFFDHYYIKHPLQRLIPRQAMRGAFIDTYALRWTQNKFPNETFYAIDINGLYSYCAINFAFMTGKYKVVIGSELKNLKITNENVLYNNEKIMGSILLSILPPSNLKYPFLMYRRVDGTSINTLCRACAENITRNCKHNSTERAVLGVYMISEIEFALTLGYKIMNVFEVHAYLSSENILRPFVTRLNDLKTKYSDTEPNVGKRNFYKLAANSFFGKFSQRQDKTNVTFVTSQADLEKVALNENIQDILILSDEICMVYSTKIVSKLPPNMKYNVYIGSQITAYARQRIYSDILTLLSIPNCTIYHVNCDSVFFSLPSRLKHPFDLNHVVGNYKNVVDGTILSYLTLGPRQYNVTYINSDEVKSITHISGLSLENSFINVKPNFQQLFSKFLEKHDQQILDQFIMPQFRKKVNIKQFKVETFSQKYTLRNNVTNRRRIEYKTDRLFTLPLGYMEE